MSVNGFPNSNSKQWVLPGLDPCQRAWLEVDSKAIEANARALKNFIGKNIKLKLIHFYLNIFVII